MVLIELDKKEKKKRADGAVRADWVARLGLWMPRLIYGCMKCRVRPFHRENELPGGSKTVMLIFCLLVMTR